MPHGTTLVWAHPRSLAHHLGNIYYIFFSYRVHRSVSVPCVSSTGRDGSLLLRCLRLSHSNLLDQGYNFYRKLITAYGQLHRLRKPKGIRHTPLAFLSNYFSPKLTSGITKMEISEESAVLSLLLITLHFCFTFCASHIEMGTFPIAGMWENSSSEPLEAPLHARQMLAN